MIRYTYWWGIQLSAESEEEEVLLKQLDSTLAEKANDYPYEDGSIETSKKPVYDDGTEREGGYTIVFNR